MKTAQDYLAEKLQIAENSKEFSAREAFYWQQKYFELLKKNGKTIDDMKIEIETAMKNDYLLLRV